MYRSQLYSLYFIVYKRISSKIANFSYFTYISVKLCLFSNKQDEVS